MKKQNEYLVDVPIYSIRMVRERTEQFPMQRIGHAGCVAHVASMLIGDRPIEHLVVLILDAKNKVKGCSVVAQGGDSGLHVAVKDILRTGIVSPGVAIALAHNHPSGDPTPSEEDLSFTRRLLQAAKIVGLTVLDHVIVTDDPTVFYSMLDQGVGGFGA